VEEIEQTVKEFILTEFLPGEDPDELASDTPLVTGGVLDSLATLRLVAFLEERFTIEIAAHEADIDNLDTLTTIGRLVAAKLPTVP
jgi:acyl carrier protein